MHFFPLAVVCLAVTAGLSSATSQNAKKTNVLNVLDELLREVSGGEEGLNLGGNFRESDGSFISVNEADEHHPVHVKRNLFVNCILYHCH